MHFFRLTKRWMALTLLCVTASFCHADDLTRNPAVQAFIQEMVDKHQFNKKDLNVWFKEAKTQPSIIAAMQRPAESKAWYQYRAIFLTPERIQAGVEFWKTHESALLEAQKRYGVPPEVVTAIIGVETFYGKNKGSYRVLDALSTLAFDYPPRAAFFKSELAHFFLLCREHHFDPLIPKGSYAGAMGMPQFISSSYRHYAVTLDDKSEIDLINNPSDAIGSVAHYFKQHGWKTGQAIAVPATLKKAADASLIADRKNPKPTLSLADAKTYGIVTKTKTNPNDPFALLELEGSDNKPEYWLGMNNFYVITRYNHSSLYAMAVYQLSEAIKKQKLAS